MRFFALFLSAMLVSTGVTAQVTDDLPRKLAAYSKTAVAITGNVVMDGTIIRFSNGESLPWQAIHEEGSTTVYEVLSTMNPVLLNNNTLCGDQPIARAVVKENDEKVTMLLFDESNIEPVHALINSGNACASFSYIKIHD